MDNKCLKNEGKTASSSYPPRGLNSKQSPINGVNKLFMGLYYKGAVEWD